MPTYQLVEVDRQRKRRVETFEAPDDRTALMRIEGEPRGIHYELWRDDELIDEGQPRYLG
jgi:hypothetical protein